MKRLLTAILALVLLTGCATQVPVETTDVTAAASAADTRELYDPSNPVAQAAGSTIRAYGLDAGCTGIAKMGDDLLLFFTQDGQTRLLLCAGKNCAVKAEATLDCVLAPGSGTLAVSDKGIAYYDAAANEVVVLGPQLQTATRVAGPQNMEGAPVLSQELDTLYYCTGSDIRAFDLENGSSRLLKSQQVLWQELVQCCFDGTVLLCQVGEADGDVYTCFLSTENGETLGIDPSLENIETYGEGYLLTRSSGSVQEVLFGALEEPLAALNVGLEDKTIYPTLSLGGAVTACQDEDGLELALYSVVSGLKTAEVTIPGIASIQSVLAQEDGLWFIATVQETGEKTLFYWAAAKSMVEDETLYTGQRYTAEAPDTQTLMTLAEQARQMGSTYDVDIRIWEDAVEQDCDYVLEAEYQPAAIENGLEALETALANYPENFFATLGGGTGSGRLHICLVRGISGDLSGVQYWGDGEAYIAIAIGSKVERTLYHELSHVLDTYIIARSQKYDTWDALNPEGFAYDLSYDLYLSRTQSEYLDEKERGFINSFAMTYPKEDRATILEYAMLPDTAGYFTSETMQQKLGTVCEAIREAFGWEDDESIFLWEQYLAEPQADNN